MTVPSAGPPQCAPMASWNRSSHSSTRPPRGSRSCSRAPGRRCPSPCRPVIGSPARTQRVGHRLGRLEVGQRPDADDGVAADARSRQRRLDPGRRGSPAGKPPSGCDGRRQVGHVPADERDHADGRHDRTEAAWPAPWPRTPARVATAAAAQPDEHEDHRVGERVVVVVRQPGNDRRQARRRERQERRRPQQAEPEPPGGEPLRAAAPGERQTAMRDDRDRSRASGRDEARR